MSDLHERAAKALGWSVRDTQSLSMQSLRDLVRPVDPDLAREMSYLIQSGAYARGERLGRKTRGHAAKSKPLACENCGGGLVLEDPSYGLVCPACGIRVAGPFESGHDIPDYKPASRGKGGEVVIPSRRGSGRQHAEKASLKIWQRDDWKAPGSSVPIKYTWKLVRPYVREDEVEEWLEIYRRDHPGVEFVASATKPPGKRGPKIMKGPGSEY
ncbi:MAG TPA: hypothetical protein VLE97_05845 [Gaiellaceae bacterium]|nr:hypothetical protein [Gaiellaceae bacterium]